MAQKRMFSMQIVDTDAFIEMPATSQLLYFHLSMRADDDGFVSSPKKIMRMIGAKDDDLKILLSKRFILGFESGIIVIKHWRINNYIQNDRYKETAYLKEKQTLNIKENGSYTECIQNVSKVDAQIRLDKVSIDKTNTATKVAQAEKLISKMSLEEFIASCRKSPQRHINLIGEYADTINPRFTTYGQWQTFLKRNLRASRDLAPFTNEQIAGAMDEIKKAQGEGWLRKYTLETLTKFLN